jgi:hypothetical protein
LDVAVTEAKWTPSTSVYATDLGDELVLLDSSGREMYTLNATGRAAWQALPATLDEAVSAVLRDFEVEPTRASEDVFRLLAELSGAGLITPTP